MTLKMEGNEGSYLLDSVDIEKNTLNTIILKINSKNKRAKAVIPLSRQECKRLVGELIKSL